ncbi:MAG TPA: FAD-dependent oxidoreductase, partial [Aquabacterium sp.]|nr:FAD-dependent oxidoreductase [Aquabacterium sp.]
MDFDVLIIGSGFGGSVAALRAAQKGYRVAVIEQGRWIQPEEMRAAAQQPTRFLWQPSLGLKGFFAQDFFRHVSLVRGIGVGGGSIVFAAVLLEPQDGFYRDPAWQHLAPRDWRAELAPHLQTAQRMLGMAVNPHHGLQDTWLQQTASKLGVPERFGPVPQAIHFGDPEKARPGCTFCGNCTSGCAIGAKNSLDKNYLQQAQQLGVKILSERRVTLIEPLPSGGYRLSLQTPGRGGSKVTLSAQKVIVSAGVVGTLELLMACRDRHRTLPRLSGALGQHVRTNCETIAAVTHPPSVQGLRQGTTISSHFYLD